VWSQLTAEPRAPIEDAMLGSAGVMLDHLTSDHPLVDGIRPAQSSVAALVLHAVGTTSAANGTIRGSKRWNRQERPRKACRSASQGDVRIRPRRIRTASLTRA
jgi:hypothetical protein